MLNLYFNKKRIRLSGFVSKDLRSQPVHCRNVHNVCIIAMCEHTKNNQMMSGRWRMSKYRKYRSNLWFKSTSFLMSKVIFQIDPTGPSQTT